MARFERGGPRRDSGSSRGPPRRDFGGSGGGGRDFGPREMHKATCSDCGQECTVPFKPTEGKPVFCRDCYAKRRQF